MTMDLLDDFNCAYDDFGVDAVINDASSPVRMMFDSGIEEYDTKIIPMRIRVSDAITSDDKVVMQGKTFAVLRVTPYGDQNEENTVMLSRKKSD